MYSCAIEKFTDTKSRNNIRLELKICSYITNEYFKPDVESVNERTLVHYKMHHFELGKFASLDCRSINFPRAVKTLSRR